MSIASREKNWARERDAWWSPEFSDFLWSALAEVRPATILDVGCGIGTFAGRLASRFPCGGRVTGIDIDPARV
jgi:ubiquinone/menaquinone biosynthesis C-methylase UbiE